MGGAPVNPARVHDLGSRIWRRTAASSDGDSDGEVVWGGGLPGRPGSLSSSPYPHPLCAAEAAVWQPPIAGTVPPPRGTRQLHTAALVIEWWSTGAMVMHMKGGDGATCGRF
jgi:hypothetical protein